ncbi:DNA-binding response regulator [Amycolatopsis sp. NPDC049252]|uniref:helix-turn-helix transcriptional regulator n=1 Tax=Amycolatopsis sp. NPDC049252 TaxID=3363933 RepID=UPI003722E2F2
MAVHVAVLDPLPIFQKGVAAVLSIAGYVVEEPPDPHSWAQQTRSAVVLLTLCAERDWQLLERLCRAALRTAVIALVEEAGTGPGVRAIRAGARSVLPRQATAAALLRTVEATIEGQAVLPTAVAAALVSGGRAAPDAHAVPAENQLTWLRQLAAGTTVAQLADDAGYSERAMYRLLQTLYQQMGVSSRMQAIMRAHDLGWLSATKVRPARS